MPDLEKCPCGEIPDELYVPDYVDEGLGPKWAYAGGQCCNGWFIEFRNQYSSGDEMMRKAEYAWNHQEKRG